MEKISNIDKVESNTEIIDAIAEGIPRMIDTLSGQPVEDTIFNQLLWGDKENGIPMYYVEIQNKSEKVCTIKHFIDNCFSFEERITVMEKWLNFSIFTIFRRFDYKNSRIARFIKDMYNILDSKNYPLLSYEEDEIGCREYNIEVVPSGSRHIANILDDVRYIISVIDFAISKKVLK